MVRSLTTRRGEASFHTWLCPQVDLRGTVMGLITRVQQEDGRELCSLFPLTLEVGGGGLFNLQDPIRPTFIPQVFTERLLCARTHGEQQTKAPASWS